MIEKILFCLGLLCLVTAVVMATETVDEVDKVIKIPIVEEDKFTIPRNDDWICYDYAVAFQKENPEWDILVIAEPDNTYFEGIGDSHSVNYIINDDKSITIHDEMYNAEYTHFGWIHEPDNWYFFIDGESYNEWGGDIGIDSLIDNKEEIWDGLA